LILFSKVIFDFKINIFLCFRVNSKIKNIILIY
jgi:hypothetical protein